MARMVVGCRLFVLLMLTQSAVGGGYSSIKTKNMCKDASKFKHWKTLYKECRLFDELIGNSVGCGGNCARVNSDEECKREAMKEVGSDDSIWANLGGHVVWGPVTCRDMSEYCKNGQVFDWELECGGEIDEVCCGGSGLREHDDCDWEFTKTCSAPPLECGDHDIPAGECDCKGNTLDECGVCGGTGIAPGKCDCEGNVLDKCNVCGGDGSSCVVVGCDGVANSGAVLDACGVCGGDGTSCCVGKLDECHVCNGPGIKPGHCDCAGSVLDECNVCGGDNSSCCPGTVDACGVCNGPGIPRGECDCQGHVLDACGVCGGDGSSCCAGKYDRCGVCNGPGILPGKCDCWGNELDACGVCGGSGTTCLSPPPPSPASPSSPPPPPPATASTISPVVSLKAKLPMSKSAFTDAKRTLYTAAIAASMRGITAADVAVAAVEDLPSIRRAEGEGGWVVITTHIKVKTRKDGEAMASTWDVAVLNRHLARTGMPAAVLVSAPAVIDQPTASQGSGAGGGAPAMSMEALIGAGVGAAVVVLVGAAVCVSCRNKRLQGKRAGQLTADIERPSTNSARMLQVAPGIPDQKLPFVWTPPERPHAGQPHCGSHAGGHAGYVQGRPGPVSGRPGFMEYRPQESVQAAYAHLAHDPPHAATELPRLSQHAHYNCRAGVHAGGHAGYARRHSHHPHHRPEQSTMQSTASRVSAHSIAGSVASIPATPQHPAGARVEAEPEAAESVQVSEMKEGGTIDKDACVVCLDRTATHAVIPCGHRCVCEECETLVSTCPMCRGAKDSTLRVFT